VKVGILGGGQLARMLAEAGGPLGLDFLIVDPKADACAARLGNFIQAEYDDLAALDRLSACDRVTCDFENVPAEALERLGARATVHPGPEALAAAQDRLAEKTRFVELGIETVGFRPVDSRPALAEAVEQLGFPAVLKTRRFGYDGKGQVRLDNAEELEPAWQALGGQPLIVEQWVEFDFECAISAVRNAAGQMRFWPLSRTWHRDGILRLAASVPAPEALQSQAESHVRELAEALDFVGCLTLELFCIGERLLANEFAPRVHNSAHWTIEGAACSQFENHLRAVCGWPIGETAARGWSVMFNFIGQMPPVESWLAVPGMHWHDYDKASRPGRKVGHATLVAPGRSALGERLARCRHLYPEKSLDALRSLLG